jgi:hypothetical protein
LNAGRAITLCCIANKASNTLLISKAAPSGPGSPESMLLGAAKLPTKPAAYRKLARNTA